MPGKFGYKYVYSAKHITTLLGKIQETGRPDKLTITYVQKVWLLSDAKYSAVLDILRDMGFIDNTGMPLDLYAEYQNPSLAKTALSKGIKNAYPELFKAYPNAQNLEKSKLSGYFKQITGEEKRTLERIVATFITICGLADFPSTTENELSERKQQGEEIPNTPPNSSSLIPITMNIQIVIPSDASSEQYDKIFSSIKKFLTP